MVRHKLDSLHAFARKSHLLRIECRGCGHVVVADPVVLAMETRGSKEIAAIERRMRCLQCGERAAHITAEGQGEAKPPKWIVASSTREA